MVNNMQTNVRSGVKLPLNVTPTYTCELPSTKKQVRYRPFLVREEKLLLIALETEDDKTIQDAVVQVIQNCVLEKTIEVSTLPIFDFEYLFLKVRSKAVGEIVNLKIKCPDDEKQLVDVPLDLEKVQVQYDDKHKKEIEFETGYGVVMRYPTIESFTSKITATQLSFDLVSECIGSIYKGDEVFDRNNIDKKELDEWVNNLTQNQFTKMAEFFGTMPKITHTLKYKNPKSGKEFEMQLNGIRDFFQLPSTTTA
jgi:hypothetical protein|tara:strand:- start:286 stop:1044 length:759 start_codon:yes stop_codon:yes gene_type:complete